MQLGGEKGPGKMVPKFSQRNYKTTGLMASMYYKNEKMLFPQGLPGPHLLILQGGIVKTKRN